MTQGPLKATNLKKLTVNELKDTCRKMKITGFSGLAKDDLVSHMVKQSRKTGGGLGNRLRLGNPLRERVNATNQYRNRTPLINTDFTDEENLYIDSPRPPTPPSTPPSSFNSDFHSFGIKEYSNVPTQQEPVLKFNAQREQEARNARNALNNANMERIRSLAPPPPPSTNPFDENYIGGKKPKSTKSKSTKSKSTKSKSKK